MYFSYSYNKIKVSEDIELAKETYKLLEFIGKTLISNALPGENSRSINTEKIAVFSKRVMLTDLSENGVKFSCNETANFEKNQESCNLLKFKLFSKSSEIIKSDFYMTRNNTINNNMTESKFNIENALDLVAIIDFNNIGSKMSPMLSITISNISSINEISLNKTNSIIELELPIVTQRSDQNEISNDNLTCKFLSSENIWSDYGCNRTGNSSQTIKCECNHLTLFALDIGITQYFIRDENILRNVTNLDGVDFEKVGKNFAFILILILILINMFSLLLYYLDLNDRANEEYYKQKIEVLGTFFPDPKDQYKDFFALGTSPKEDVLEFIKMKMILDNSLLREKEDDKSHDNVTMMGTYLNMTPSKEFIRNNKSPSGLPNGSPSGSPKGMQGQPDIMRMDFENPEVNPRNFEAPLQTTAGLSRNNGQSGAVTPENKKIHPLHLFSYGMATMLSSLSGHSLSSSRPLERNNTRSSPSAFTDAIPIDKSLVRLEVPQFANCGFFSCLWVALKMTYPLFSIFFLYDPGFPRPFRMLLLTTRIIGYMGISAIFYNDGDEFQSKSEAIYVGLICAAIMFVFSWFMGKLLMINTAISRTDKNQSEILEKRIEEAIEQLSIKRHFFTMCEYYGLIIERKRITAKDLIGRYDTCIYLRRLIGVLIAFFLDIFLLVFIILSCSEFSDELIHKWELSFVYSLLFDIIGTQLVKVFFSTFMVTVIQKIWQTATAYNLSAIILGYTGMEYF